jgi:nitrite reductase (cytochrome c-552)
MSDERSANRTRKALYITVGLALALLTVAVLLLLENISTRKKEAREVVFRLVPIDETTTDPSQWGKNFPRQYDGYKRTVDKARTRYGGSEAFSKVDSDPRLKTIWAGYAFSVDFNEDRGHAYMLEDQRNTRRVQQFKQPGACLHCHASITDVYRKVGIEGGAPGTRTDPLTSENGYKQLFAGFEKVCAMPYGEASKLAEHPVSCSDCHDPDSMQLRVTRPGFLNGVQRLAESDDPVPHLVSVDRWRKGDRKEPYNPNVLATRQELRSMVCGQCHVEYYFSGEGKLLTYPWHNGLKMEQALAYYDKIGFKDWQHKITGAPVLKAQHPEFETWSQGIHARSGVACADCHMPYKREGAIKISDHHVRSPLLNISRACQPCHPQGEAELLGRAEQIQERTASLMNRAMQAEVELIGDIEKARAAGLGERPLAAAQQLQRASQFRLDYINAENSMGFHAPQEAARILGEAIDLARQGQLVVARQAAGTAVPATQPAGAASAAR